MRGAALAIGLGSLAVASGAAPPAGEFRSAMPGYQYRFPKDHGSHDDFQTEWWYYTGHLHAADGRTYGYQLTFFRRGVAYQAAAGNPSRWALRHLYFAHFAVTEEIDRRFHFFEKLSRAGLRKAGAEAERLAVWIDDWRAEATDAEHVLQAQANQLALRVRLKPEKSPVIHGAGGLSRKGAGPTESSHYYSFSRMRTEGTLTLEGQPIPVAGVSWMDHEFGSNQLGAEQIGWDWFGLQLSDATELMIYRIRRRDGSIEPASGGTWIKADGAAIPLARDAVMIDVLDQWRSPHSGAVYPARWRLRVPSMNLSVAITPTIADQELITKRSTDVTYWEGSVALSGERNGRPVSGSGYAELTGYAAPLKRRL